MVALLVLSPFAIGLSAEAGAAVAVSRGDAGARERRDAGDYGHTVAAYRTLATRGGLLYRLNHRPLDTAGAGADATVLAWADAVARRGHAESALALVGQVRTPALVSTVRRERVVILVEAARAAASAGDSLTAMERADQLAGVDVPSDLRGQVDALMTETELAAVPQLMTAERPGEAVAALDGVIRRDPRSAVAAKAVGLMPQTLLAAGRLSLQQFDIEQALGLLRRLVAEYGSRPQADTAAGLLAEAQDVSGTVVRRSGAVAPGPVRLAAKFVPAKGGDYALGPYYAGRADAHGDFTIPGVPVGGPYVLEVQNNGSWVTPVDRDTGRPAYEVSVTALTPADLTFVVLPG